MRSKLVAVIAVLVVGVLALLLLGRRQDASSEVESASRHVAPVSPPEAGPAQVPAPAVEQSGAGTETTSQTEDRRAAASTPERKPEPASPAGVRGKVVDDLGAVVRTFEIETARPDANGRDEPWVNSRRTTPRKRFEDAMGTFLLEHLQNGQWLITAHGTGDTRSAPVLVAVPSTEPEVVLTLPRPAVLTGSVLATDRSPVGDARIHVQYAGERAPRLGMGRDPEPRARTDALGHFQLEGLLAGSLQVVATHEGHCDSPWTTVVLAPGATQSVELTLAQGGRIVGRIDPALGPVAGRQVSLMSFKGSIGWRSARSDDSGRYAIEHVIPQDYVIELEAESNQPQAESSTAPDPRKPVTVREGETSVVDFGLPGAPVKVFGVILCEARPLSGATVHAVRAKTGSGGGKSDTTSDDGRFALEVDEPGPYVFTVEKNWASYAHFERVIEVRDQVEMTFEVPGGSITGTVRSSTGKPLDHVPITVLRGVTEGEDVQASFWTRYRRMKTDEQGRFEFGLLSPGTYVLRTPDGFMRDSPPPRTPHGRVVLTGLKLGAGKLEPLTIDLPAECQLRGKVVDAAGKPVAGASVNVMDPNGVGQLAYFEITTDATGSFLVTSLAAGRFTASVRRGDQRATSAPFDLDPTKAGDVKITLP